MIGISLLHLDLLKGQYLKKIQSVVQFLLKTLKFPHTGTPPGLEPPVVGNVTHLRHYFTVVYYFALGSGGEVL